MLKKFRLGKKSAIVLFLVSVPAVGLILFLLNNKDTTPISDVSDDVITYSTDKPDETKPDGSYAWNGRPEEPRFIKLPTISVEGFIQKNGVDQNNQVAVPNNIHLAGWFVDSVRPGQTGLSIIVGHVDGLNEAGIFKNLEKLRIGDKFTVEQGSGKVLSYSVKDVTTVDEEKAVNSLFSQDPKVKSQLNLITCGGKFNQSLQSYDQRVIVSSELID